MQQPLALAVLLVACLGLALAAPSPEAAATAAAGGCAQSTRDPHRGRPGCQMAKQSIKKARADKGKKAKMQDFLVNLKLLKSNAVEQSMMVEDGKGISREHKAFFINYPASKNANQVQKFPKKQQQQQQQQQKQQKQKQQQQQQQQQQQRRKKPGGKRRESDIYFIRLPPSPYSYVPGLGYVSQPTTFSRVRPSPSVIQLPLDFVSNGKPVGVRVRRPGDSPLVRLDRGPYRLDGKPAAPHLLV